jgi:hypothetical protein
VRWGRIERIKILSTALILFFFCLGCVVFSMRQVRRGDGVFVLNPEVRAGLFCAYETIFPNSGIHGRQ